MTEPAPLILVLDDEPMVTTTIKNYLSLAGGCEAVVFNHPAEALEYLKTHPVDAIISDQIMPGMNGLEFFTQVKEVQPEAIRVLLTGYAEKEDAIRAINQIGLFQFIEKPWSNEQLLLAVRNGLERKRLYSSLQKRIGELQIAGDEIDRLKNGLVELYLEKSVEPAEEGAAAGATAAQARHELRKIVGSEMQSRARRFIYAFAAVSVLLVATVSYTVYRSFFAIHREAVRLQVQIGEIKTKQLNAAEVERLRNSMPSVPAREINPSERIIAQYEASVCLIQGSYVFSDKDSGKLLRLVAQGSASAPQVDASGIADVTLEGNGPPLENSYSGTGFLVSADGKILTNRHVGEPWWADAQAQKIIAAGFWPEHRNFVAYFPHRPQAFALKTLKVSDKADLALLAATPKRDLPKPIPLDEEMKGTTPGAPIVLIGYPLGLEPILVRVREEELAKIPNYLNLSVDQMAQELARRNLIHPFISQGHISNITKEVLTYEAVTSMGGSGGPLFNQEGRVVAVNFAVLPQFSGANLAVPIRYALALMKN
jgi:CheY-like chemotaxis protein